MKVVIRTMKKSSDAKCAILCCGEALIDMIQAPTAAGTDGFVPHSGGAIFNTAIALGRLAVPVGMLAGLSDDLFGQQLERDLVASRVDTAHIVTSDRPTTLAFVQLTDGQASYSFYDENTAGRMLTVDSVPSLATNIRALYFGGISLACEPAADTYAALLTRESATRVVMIDPNIRPSFINNEARYRDRLTLMIRQTDILKVSDEDLDWLSGTRSSQDDKARSLLAQGPSTVILTRGSAGSSAFLSSGEKIDVAAPIVEVVDTVGAGDTFNAGVLCKLSKLGLLEKSRLKSITVDELREALVFGAQVAAITVSRTGAHPPWEHEL